MRATSNGPQSAMPAPARRAEPERRVEPGRSRRVACRLPRDVVMMVLRNGLWLTVAGVVVGLVATFAISRVLSGFLSGAGRIRCSFSYSATTTPRAYGLTTHPVAELAPCAP